jgi:hypothetical protein
VSAQLAGELLEPHGAEDALAEEALDERHEGIFADGEPLAVPFDPVGRDLAVGAAVIAGHVGVLLARTAVHSQRLVAGGAADHAGEEVGLRAAAAIAAGALPEPILRPGEQRHR